MDEVEITGIYSGNVDRHKNAGDGAFSRETGFPSPARDHYEKPLSLDEHLIHRPAATFFVRVKGDAMQHEGIFSGDILIVDRSIQPDDNSTIIMLSDGSYSVQKLERHNGKMYLKNSNNSSNKTPISDEKEYEVWGVVTYTIHKCI